MTSVYKLRIGLCRIFFVTICLFCFVPVISEELNSPTFGYSVDLPEGFTLTEKDPNGTAYVFKSSILPVTALISVFDNGQYTSSEQALNGTLKKFGATSESEDVNWRNKKCCVSSFNMKLSTDDYSGWGVSAILPENKGIIVFLAFCPTNNFDLCSQFIISTLDSLCIDRGSYYESGIITSYAYPSENKKIDVTLNIDNKIINTQLDSVDSEASNFVITREYSVISLYANNPLWKEAWLRYYRLICRDSYSRMKRPAFDIYNALISDCKDDTDLAQKILTWTQSFEYKRAEEKNDTDFTSLPDILLNKGSDCDSRSMLVSILLKNMNIDSIFFVSAEYSHAITGLVSTHPGHSFSADKKDYLTGETTAKNLTWGMIAEDMQDESKWFAVIFP